VSERHPMRKHDIYMSISHSEGFHELRRRGKKAKFNMKKGEQEYNAMTRY